METKTPTIEHKTVEKPFVVKLLMRDLLDFCHQENTKEYWDNVEKLFGYVCNICPGFEDELEKLVIKKLHMELVIFHHETTLEEAQIALRSIITPVKKQLTCIQKHRLADLSVEMPELKEVFTEFACKNAHQN